MDRIKNAPKSPLRREEAPLLAGLEAPEPPAARPPQPARRVLTVSQLTAAIRGALAGSFGDVWVSGEISGFKLAASGHAYFTLKDASAQLRCACFRNTLRLLRFRPGDGLAVVARGKIDVYEQRGEYQMLVDWLEPHGFGALQLAFEQLKKRLEAEGLFAPERKRPLPPLPRRVGIVTSRSGAVIRDMVTILTRRFPGIHIRLYPALVQGEGSVEAVVEGIRYFSRSGWADVLIVGRGGGSLEDLWTFNEEAVARAISECAVPVISAVGHETDFTIADFAADLRAPTPSAAAELAVPNKADIEARVEVAARHLERAIRWRLARKRSEVERLGVDRAVASLTRRINRGLQRVDDLENHARLLLRSRIEMRRRSVAVLEGKIRRFDPRLRLSEFHRRLDRATTASERAIRARLAEARRRLDWLGSALRQLSPVAILERGYALVRREDGLLVRRAADAPPGTPLSIRLAEGEIRAHVRPDA